MEHVINIRATTLSANSSTSITAGSNSSSSVQTSTAGPTAAANDGTNYSTGVVAGIAVACAVGGALFASAILLCCLRRRPPRRPVPPPPPPPAAHDLPQQTPDSEIRMDMNSLSVLVKNHVASFYHEPQVTINQYTLADVVKSPQVPMPELINALADVRYRQDALHYLISHVMFSRIGLMSDPRSTFLPPDVLSCFQSIQRGPAVPKGNTASDRWRVTTAAMIQQARSHGRNPPLENIDRAIELLDSVLVNFAVDSNEQRRRNLAEIFKRAAGFGFLLFAQIGTFKFSWRMDHAREPHSIVYWPALVRTVDSGGNVLRPRRVLEDMKVLHIA